MKEIVEKLIGYYTTPAHSTKGAEDYIHRITAVVLRKYLKYLTGGKKVK